MNRNSLIRLYFSLFIGIAASFSAVAQAAAMTAAEQVQAEHDQDGDERPGQQQRAPPTPARGRGGWKIRRRLDSVVAGHGMTRNRLLQ